MRGRILMLAAALMLLLAAPASATTVVSADFTAGFDGWTPDETCGLLCDTKTTQRATGGAADGLGWVRSRYVRLAALPGLATGHAGAYKDFTWSGASPSSADVTWQERADVRELVALLGTATTTLTLTDRTTSTARVVATRALTASSAWTERTATLDPAWFVNGHSYRLTYDTQFDGTVQLLGYAEVGLDGVRLVTGPAAPEDVSTVLGNVTATSAALSGLITSTDADATWQVEYGTTTGYGLTATGGTVLAGTDRPWSRTLVGLLPNTTYHARVTATNPGGSRSSYDVTWRTPVAGTAPAPPATVINAFAVTVNGPRGCGVSGTYDPRGLASHWSIEYGTTTSYGSETPVTDVAASTSAVQADGTLGALVPNTTYHLRVVVVTQSGTVYGPDQICTTPQVAQPTSLSIAASDVCDTTATLSGQITSADDDAAWRVEWGTTTAYGNATDGGTVAAGSGRAWTTTLTGLTKDQTYHARLVAATDGGAVATGDVTFVAACPSQPQPNPGPTVAVTTNNTPSSNTSTTNNGGSTTTTGGTQTTSNVTNGDTGGQPSGPAVPIVIVVTVPTRADVAKDGQPTITTTIDTSKGETQYFVQYGPTTNYGSTTKRMVIPKGTGNVDVASSALAGLNAGGTYHARPVIVQNGQVMVGKDMTFTAPTTSASAALAAVKTKPTLTSRAVGRKLRLEVRDAARVKAVTLKVPGLGKGAKVKLASGKGKVVRKGAVITVTGLKRSVRTVRLLVTLRSPKAARAAARRVRGNERAHTRQGTARLTPRALRSRKKR